MQTGDMLQFCEPHKQHGSRQSATDEEVVSHDFSRPMPIRKEIRKFLTHAASQKLLLSLSMLRTAVDGAVQHIIVIIVIN